MKRFRAIGALSSLVLFAGVLVSAPQIPQPKADEGTRLVVVCVFDQLRGDYPSRWKSAFGNRGFKRIMSEGTHYTNCHYPYAVTVTGPGHASVSTGATPRVHGIITNEWYDPVKAQAVYCSTSDRYKNIPQKMGVTQKRSGGGSPELIKVPTLGDSLKEMTQGKGKVFALSSKDRGAVLLAGKRADGCYWWDTDVGHLGTSTFFRDALEPWVSAMNAEGFAQGWLGKTWERFRADLDYNKLAGPDLVIGEANAVNAFNGPTFPHKFPTKPEKAYYNAVYASPFANELLLDFAFRAIEAEQLGKDEVPDLLFLSFSSNDIVGHAWGPDSHEVLDITLRTDDLLARMFHELDLKVGKGKWTVYLTADHGVCPLPELSKLQGRDAGRIDVNALKLEAEKYLHETFKESDPKVPFLAGNIGEHLYLNRSYLKTRNLEASVVAESLAKWLMTQPGIHKAIPRSQLVGAPDGTDAFMDQCKESYDPERGGDLLLIQKPYWLFGKGTGTSHGTPYAYDTHVPLMIMGKGVVKKGTLDEKVTPQHIAALVSRELRMAPPAGCPIKLPPLNEPVSLNQR